MRVNRLLLLFCCVLFAPSLVACVCAPPVLKRAFRSSDFVFVGVAEEVSESGVHRMRVVDALKNVRRDQHVTVLTDTQTSCGFTFPRGERRLVMARRAEHGGIVADFCMNLAQDPATIDLVKRRAWWWRLFARRAAPLHPADALWTALQPHCGKAFEGRLVEGTEASDAAIGAQRLVMHVRSCTANEIRIPFHVGENRSRTWVLTRTTNGVRLKHDHRHEDGTPDRITQYGGDTRPGDADLSLDFFADAHTATLIPTARTNIWTIALEPGRTFTYALRREESGRRFRVEFDLAREVGEPLAAW